MWFKENKGERNAIDEGALATVTQRGNGNQRWSPSALPNGNEFQSDSDGEAAVEMKVDFPRVIRAGTSLLGRIQSGFRRNRLSHQPRVIKVSCGQ